jgi:dolichol-phosphate mannosyltransferase
MRAAVVIPTFREAENVGRIVAAVRDELPGAAVLVVDDASDDGTADLAEAAGATVLRRAGTRGLGPAYRAGFARALEAGWDPIYQMDADFSHDPADLRRLAGDADLVLGSRWVDGGGTVNWGLGRRALSRFGSAYARAWLGVPVRDLTGGFKRWRADTLRAVGPETLACDGYAFQVEATYRAWKGGARIVEVPIVFTERRAGASKMSGAIALEAAWRVPALRR